MEQIIFLFSSSSSPCPSFSPSSSFYFFFKCPLLQNPLKPWQKKKISPFFGCKGETQATEIQLKPSY